MKAKELRDRTDSELAEMERDFSRDLWKTRFENFTNQLDDTAKIRRLRRDVARIKTLRTERAAAQSNPAKASEE